MEEMMRIGNKICSKGHGYPYAVLEENEWDWIIVLMEKRRLILWRKSTH